MYKLPNDDRFISIVDRMSHDELLKNIDDRNQSLEEWQNNITYGIEHQHEGIATTSLKGALDAKRTLVILEERLKMLSSYG